MRHAVVCSAWKRIAEDWRHLIFDAEEEVWKNQDYYNPRIKESLCQLFSGKTLVVRSEMVGVASGCHRWPTPKGSVRSEAAGTATLAGTAASVQLGD